MTAYNNAQNRYDLSRGIGTQAMQPIQGANAATTLGKILQAYFASKGMRGAEQGMLGAEKDVNDTRAKDMASVLGAYRQDTPYNQSEGEMFPGEAPIAGLSNKGTGADLGAMAHAMMGTSQPDLQKMGLASVMGGNKELDPMGKIQPANYTPESLQTFKQSGNYNDLVDAPVKLIPVRRGDRVDYVHPQSGVTIRSEAINPSPDSDPELKRQQAVATGAGKGQSDRWNTQIDEAFSAGDGIPVLNRSLSLLKEGVKTGGWDNVKLKISNVFGVTGADEAELSANLGRAVLSQLRKTFGAAFTEREGARLAFIEANFGKSTEANVRLLTELKGMATREIKRGIRAAKRAGDDDSATELQLMLKEAEAEITGEPEPKPEGETYEQRKARLLGQ